MCYLADQDTKTNGNPIILQDPCRADPDAIVAWTGKGSKVKVENYYKTNIGRNVYV